MSLVSDDERGGGNMRIWKLLSSLDGRINRRLYWRCFLQFTIVQVGALVCIVMIASSELLPRPALFALVGALALFVAWTTVVISAKRLHDRNKSAHFVWLFVLLPVVLVGIIETTRSEILVIPVLILELWAFVEIGLLTGTVGANRFGPDPLEGR